MNEVKESYATENGCSAWKTFSQVLVTTSRIRDPSRGGWKEKQFVHRTEPKYKAEGDLLTPAHVEALKNYQGQSKTHDVGENGKNGDRCAEFLGRHAMADNSYVPKRRDRCALEYHHKEDSDHKSCDKRHSRPDDISDRVQDTRKTKNECQDRDFDKSKNGVVDGAHGIGPFVGQHHVDIRWNIPVMNTEEH